MKAIVAERTGGPGVLAVRNMPAPQVHENEILVNVEVAGVNYADILNLAGNYAGGPQPPYVPGREFSGRVAATGERVMGYAEFGAFAEQIAAPAHRVWPAPEKFSAAEAAAFPVNFFTAYFLYWQAGLIGGEHEEERFPKGRRPRVLIHAAAGGVGTAAVQIGKILGVEMFGTSSTDANLEGAAKLGLQHGINYKRQDYMKIIKEQTNGEGVDAVFEMVGGEETARSIRCLAFLGRCILYGSASGKPPQFDPPELYARATSVHGLWLSRMSAKIEIMKKAGAQLTEWVEAGQLRPVIGHHFPLEKAADALQMLADGKNFGKVVLAVK